MNEKHEKTSHCDYHKAGVGKLFEPGGPYDYDGPG
jgi:hypothetical protein